MKNYGGLISTLLHSSPFRLCVSASSAQKIQQSWTRRQVFIYHIPYKHCSSVYIGETGRNLKLRLREHKSTAHSANTCVSSHKIRAQHQWEGVKVLEKEKRSDTRKIREVIHIRKDPNPKINTSLGFELSPVYYSLLRSENKKHYFWKYF